MRDFSTMSARQLARTAVGHDEHDAYVQAVLSLGHVSYLNLLTASRRLGSRTVTECEAWMHRAIVTNPQGIMKDVRRFPNADHLIRFCERGVASHLDVLTLEDVGHAYAMYPSRRDEAWERIERELDDVSGFDQQVLILYNVLKQPTHRDEAFFWLSRHSKELEPAHLYSLMVLWGPVPGRLVLAILSRIRGTFALTAEARCYLDGVLERHDNANTES